MASKSSRWGLGIFTAVSLTAYGGMVGMQTAYGTLRDHYVAQTVAWYLLAFVAYVGAIVWVEKRGEVSMRWVWITAVSFRLLLLLTTPTLSDDVYRYIWDGYLVSQGVSPYAYAIEAPELDYLDIPQRAQANNTWMASPYLPAAQFVFAGLAFIFPLHPLFMQIIMVLFDLLSAFLLSRLLALVSLPRHRLLLYLWNPLIIVEAAHGAHIDTWMIWLTLLAIWFTLTAHPKRWLAPLFLALATLTKILPALLFPVLFWRWSWRQRLLYGGLTAVILMPFGLQAGWGLSGEPVGRGLFGALRIYVQRWAFYGGIPHWIEQWLMQFDFQSSPRVLTREWMLLCLILVMVLVWWLARGQRHHPLYLLRLMALPGLAYLLLTPTVHPWYLLLLLTFLPFLPPGQGEPRWRWLDLWPLLYLNGAVFLTYLTYSDPPAFTRHEWIRQVEWWPTLGLLALVLVYRGWRLRRTAVKQTTSIFLNLH